MLVWATNVEFELLRESLREPEPSGSRVPSGAMRHFLDMHCSAVQLKEIFDQLTRRSVPNN